MPSAMLRSGLCSVTLRALCAARVVDVAVAAGLAAVEWGADVHVPAVDRVAIAEVRRRTEAAGLAVASYGSYLRLVDDDDLHPAVVAAAVALGAPRIRVWAGGLGSVDATEADRGVVVRGARALAARAADAGISVGFEFHGGTLTDTAESTVRLLEEVDRPDVGTYWQPPKGAPDDVALAGLTLLEPYVVAVHAFSWWPWGQRLPLSARAGLWGRVAALLARRGVLTDVMLEFVENDDPAAVIRDAQTLHGWIDGCRS
jgi:3-dehydroshikimate dehydratase